MGMSIDKTIEFFNGLECLTPQAKDARNVALETMHKYQKINQILDDWENSGEEDDPINIIDSIEEVLDDGKIDG